MKLIILAAVLGACAAAPQYNPFRAQYNQYNTPSPFTPYNARPYDPNTYANRARAGIDRSAAILRSDAVVNEGGYQFAYDTENGIHADESGVENNGIQAQGSYSYTGDDGQVYTVRYTAGANGFEASGAHIPTPPPVPEAIARALQENARDEAAGIFDDAVAEIREGSFFFRKAKNGIQSYAHIVALCSYNDAKYSPGVVAARTYNPQRYNAFRSGRYY